MAYCHTYQSWSYATKEEEQSEYCVATLTYPVSKVLLYAHCMDDEIEEVK